MSELCLISPEKQVSSLQFPRIKTRRIYKIIDQLKNQESQEKTDAHGISSAQVSNDDKKYTFEQINNALLSQNQVQKVEVKKEKKPRKKRSRRRYTRGSWSLEENAKYYLFLLEHKQQFHPSQSRHREKLFIQMSKFIVSRNAVQCRSHHQKKEEKQRSYEDFFIDLYKEVRDHPLVMKGKGEAEVKIQNLERKEKVRDFRRQMLEVTFQLPIIFTFEPQAEFFPIDEKEYYRLAANMRK